MKGSLPAARQAQTLDAVVAILSQCLDLDTGTLIPEFRQAEEVRHRNTPAEARTEDQAAGELVVEEMDEEEETPKQMKNGKVVKVDGDFSDLLPVSGTLNTHSHWTHSDEGLGSFYIIKSSGSSVH